MQTWVTDPNPTPREGNTRCEFKLYPSPDEVVFCENEGAAVLIAPCCGQETRVCRECMDKMSDIGTWICLECGLETDCRWTPIEFGIRWLP